MDLAAVQHAVTSLEKANGNLEPELLSIDDARMLFASYARAEKLIAYGKTMLARKLDDAAEVAREMGGFHREAKAAVETGTALIDTPQSGARSVVATSLWTRQPRSPGPNRLSPVVLAELLEVAPRESFQVLREQARKVVLEAEQHRGLTQRQHESRRAASHTDELALVHLSLALEPHVGTSIVNRAGPSRPPVSRGEKRGALGCLCHRGRLRRHRPPSPPALDPQPPGRGLHRLGAREPPHFDGIRCTDCGSRFGTENDHLEPT